MRALIICLMLFLAVQSAFASACTSNGSGNWNSVGTWTNCAGGVPGNGDTATINNGDTVTIPVGYTAIIGTSDNGSTNALQCAGGFDFSTGVLVNNGTLIYRGTVKTCGGNWSAGAGATFTHDSSLAASPSATHYTFSGTGTGKITLSGSSGSHVTWNTAVGSGYAGALGGTSSTFTTDGQLHATYVDFSNIGAANGAYFWIAGLRASGSEWYCDHCTISGSGLLNVGDWAADATFVFNNSVHTGGYNATYAIIDLPSIPAKSGGTREFKNSYWDSGSLKITASATGTNIGLSFQNNFGYGNSANLYAPFQMASPTVVLDSSIAHDNILLFYSTGGGSTVGNTLPGGSLSRTYSVHGSNTACNSTNYHPNFVSNGVALDLDQFISEVDCGGTSGAGDGIQFGDGSTHVVYNMTNSIFLCGSDGFSTSVFSYGSNTATAPTVNGHNNTICATYSTGACGFGTDAASGAAGIFGDIYDNIFFQKTSQAGCAAGSATTPNGMYAGTEDYNLVYNVTGTYWKGGAGAYTSTPGTHDVSGNPSFSNLNVNFLSCGQAIDPTVTTWADIAAKFASRAAGFTASAFITCVENGMKPSSSLVTSTAKPGGLGYVGAVYPSAPSGSISLSGATIKGAIIQ